MPWYNTGEVMGWIPNIISTKAISGRRLGSIELVQIGRLFFRGAGEVREHLHRRWFELTVITHGVGEVTAGGVAVPVREGDVFLSLPAELHGIRSSAEAPMRYDFFSF